MQKGTIFGIAKQQQKSVEQRENIFSQMSIGFPIKRQ